MFYTAVSLKLYLLLLLQQPTTCRLIERKLTENRSFTMNQVMSEYGSNCIRYYCIKFVFFFESYKMSIFIERILVTIKIQQSFEEPFLKSHLDRIQILAHSVHRTLPFPTYTSIKKIFNIFTAVTIQMRLPPGTVESIIIFIIKQSPPWCHMTSLDHVTPPDGG